jgi:hypothetical protein
VYELTRRTATFGRRLKPAQAALKRSNAKGGVLGKKLVAVLPIKERAAVSSNALTKV